MNSTWKNRLINVGVLFGAIFLFFVLFEIIIRIAGISPGYDYPKNYFIVDEDIGYAMAPNFKGTFIKQEFETNIDHKCYKNTQEYAQYSLSPLGGQENTLNPNYEQRLPFVDPSR